MSKSVALIVSTALATVLSFLAGYWTVSAYQNGGLDVILALALTSGAALYWILAARIAKE